MGRLLETAVEFEELFDRFDEISDWEPDTDADGNYIDIDGNVIDDAVEYKAMLLDAWFDTCDSMEQQFNGLAENMAVYIKSISAEADAIKQEEKRLEIRRKQKERKVDSMMDYLKLAMDRMKLTKVDMPKAKITIQNNPASCVIDDNAQLVKWAEQNNHEDCIKRVDPEIRKTQIKDLINSGINVPFAHIGHTKSLRIK